MPPVLAEHCGLSSSVLNTDSSHTTGCCIQPPPRIKQQLKAKKECSFPETGRLTGLKSYINAELHPDTKPSCALSVACLLTFLSRKATLRRVASILEHAWARSRFSSFSSPLTLHHTPVGSVGDRIDVRGHLVSLFAFVHLHNLFGVDWQILVGVYDNAEQAWVGLQNTFEKFRSTYALHRFISLVWLLSYPNSRSLGQCARFSPHHHFILTAPLQGQAERAVGWQSSSHFHRCIPC